MVPRQGLTTKDQMEEMLEHLSHVDQKKKYSMKTIRNIGSSMILLLFIVMLIHFIQMKQRGQIPHMFGYYLFSVESGSMSPTLEVGDVILSKKASNTDDLSVGTIVTYYTKEGQVVTHRITEIVKDSQGSKAYRTKGDYERNTTDREVLTQDRIIAIYCLTLKHA